MGEMDKDKQFEDDGKPTEDGEILKPADEDSGVSPVRKKTWEDYKIQKPTDDKIRKADEKELPVSGGRKKTWEDIIPSLSQGDKKKADLDPALTSEEKDALRGEDINVIPIVEIGYEKKKSDSDSHKVPKFDLANQIMSEHRKVTAKGRKGPGQTGGKTEEALSKIIPQVVVNKRDRRVKENKIIAEIVAKDIERLFKGQGISG